MFETIDGILDLVHRALTSLMDEYKLTGATVERWRWDQPVITLSWMGQDQTRLNIHGVVVDANGEPLGVDAAATSSSMLRIEANAWRDQDIEDGKRRVRNWIHKDLGVVGTDKVASRVSEAYSEASGWGVDDLKETATIRSASA